MGKIAIVYWSGTGNTAAMADAIAQGMRAAGAEVDVSVVSAFDGAALANYDKLAFGCPAMGDEVLEENEFEPFFSAAEPKLSGKTVALFGSYGWGDGQWMRDWEKRASASGAKLFESGLIIQETPGEEERTTCNLFGQLFARYK